MGFHSILHFAVILWIVNLCNSDFVYGQSSTLNVLDFGASGNGVKDDTQAFSAAWKTACSTGQTLTIPAGKTFVVTPLTLEGPCNSSSLVIQVDGNIVGPSKLRDWAPACKLGCWLCFINLQGLVIKGGGLINGRGSPWWSKKAQSINEVTQNCEAPVALHFRKCIQLQLSGFTSRDSPRAHIFIHNSSDVRISDVHLKAPENSPNTDGIDISLSSQVTIQNSFIGTGDDCVAIKGGSSFVNISHVTCGPGHGFSVGSLGQDPSHPDNVEQVNIQNCTCDKTMYCGRVKTWMGGLGYAKEIFFENMTLTQSKNPILIDQHYCNGASHCTVKAESIKVSDITFSGFTGTSASEKAITLNCSDTGCFNILIDRVNLNSGIGKPLQSTCYKATGKASSTHPPVPCLSTKQSLSPTMAPLLSIKY